MQRSFLITKNFMKTSWLKEQFQWPIVTIMAISFLLVYIIPPGWIRSIPGINTYLAWLPQVVPGIQSSIQASYFYEIAAVYYPIVFLFSPLACVGVWLIPKNPQIWFTDFYQSPWKALFFTVLFSLIAGILFFANFVVDAGYIQIEAIPHNEKKIFMALLSPLAAGGGFWMFFGTVSRTIYSIFIRETYK